MLSGVIFHMKWWLDGNLSNHRWRTDVYRACSIRLVNFLLNGDIIVASTAYSLHISLLPNRHQSFFLGFNHSVRSPPCSVTSTSASSRSDLYILLSKFMKPCFQLNILAVKYFKSLVLLVSCVPCACVTCMTSKNNFIIAIRGYFLILGSFYFSANFLSRWLFSDKHK